MCPVRRKKLGQILANFLSILLRIKQMRLNAAKFPHRCARQISLVMIELAENMPIEMIVQIRFSTGLTCGVSCVHFAGSRTKRWTDNGAKLQTPLAALLHWTDWEAFFPQNKKFLKRTSVRPTKSSSSSTTSAV